MFDYIDDCLECWKFFHVLIAFYVEWAKAWSVFPMIEEVYGKEN